MGRWHLAVAALATLVSFAASAQSIDVLWYAYSPPGSESQYREKMRELADNAHLHAGADGVRWQLTFFGPGDSPDFAAYDVLVTQSSLFADEPVDARYAGIFANRATIAAARGSRTLITGLDPDFHYIFEPAGPVLNQVHRFLINAVNWAGSGTRLGVVALDEEDYGWWTSQDSFLREEVSGWTLRDCCGGSHIPDFAAGYPINAGLTDDLFLRGTVHSGLDLAMPGYTGIHQNLNDNVDPPVPGATTMVTASEAAGATTPLAEFWCETLLPPLERVVTLPAGSRRTIPMRMHLLNAAGERVTPAHIAAAPLLQVRSGDSAQILGPFRYAGDSGTWVAHFDAGDYRQAGTYTVEAVAGDQHYEVELCQQDFVRQ